MQSLYQDFVILGGGITGASAAWFLRSLGATVRIVEKGETCGGIARTSYLNGRPYEFGPHILHATRSSTIRFYGQYGVRLVDYYAKMSYDGGLDTLVDFPFSLDTVFQLPREVARQVVAELYELNRDKVDRTNLDTYLRSVLGNTLYEAFNLGYSRKFWGIDPTQMPSNAAAEWINFRTTDKRLFPEWQGYPRGNFNAFFNWLTDGIEVIRARVLGVGETGQGVLKSVRTDLGDVQAEYFISTIPPEDLFPDVDDSLLYIGKILVALQVDCGPIFPVGVGGIYFPNHWKFNRIVEYPAINEAQYPELPDGSILGVEYPFFPRASESAGLETYIEDAVSGIQQLGYCKVTDAAVMWHASIYPVRDENQLALYEKYRERADGIQNLVMTGRYGKFKYVNMNNCVEMAVDLVASLYGVSVENMLREVGVGDEHSVSY